MKNIVGKLPIKKTITYKYSAYARKLIVDYYKKYNENTTRFEITDFWCQIRIKNAINNPKLNFKNIKINTLKKILKAELGIVFSKNFRPIQKHPKRRWMVEPGHIQLDLKILGRKETGTKERIPIFNMIETRSRFVYSQVLKSKNTPHIMEALKAGVKYLRDNGIEIKSIQTDNALLFKGTNFIHQNDFVKYFKDQKIVKRVIPLGQPQCNGCIERFHRTIDDKCSHLFHVSKTITEIKQIIYIFRYEYNFKRFHHYTELEHLPFEQRHIIPKNAISFSKISTEVDQSKKMVY